MGGGKSGYAYPVVRVWLLDEIKGNRGHDLAARASERFESTRQAIGRHLKKLVADGVLEASGRTRNRAYRFAVIGRLSRDYATAGLQEHEVRTQDIAPILKGVSQNVLEICEYGLTEILNNAIDHSGAERVHVSVERTAVEIDISVRDPGAGIFRKIRDAHHLDCDREAILELTKGKVTTDPSRHTGEGIFFTSRMMDRSAIDRTGVCRRDLPRVEERSPRYRDLPRKHEPRGGPDDRPVRGGKSA